MHFQVNLSYLFIALFVAKSSGDIVAFSGSSCDGDEGDNVPCQDECIDFNTRHSFRVLASGTHCVVAFEDGACSIPVGSIENSGGGHCSNVNTGTTVLSLRCSPNSACDTVAPANLTAHIKSAAFHGPYSAEP
ncbi:hypothetical protein CVT26_000322 [Gymnopilus dilepis]|uniref:Uncharacterized protein n=1 Tax=Gymnopilus dilepis TaxID=231916 RepID=A0A409VHJ6_9AGAR|nr:hypothetical protein CVT26_000322 [Gymnopilus dilepis]